MLFSIIGMDNSVLHYWDELHGTHYLGWIISFSIIGNDYTVLQ